MQEKRASGEIYVEATLEKLPCLVDEGTPVFFLYDSNVSEMAASVREMLHPVSEFSITTSEQTKTMDTVLEIVSWLLDSGADRNALVLAAGGGILTDIAGFAASIYKRGVKAAYIPTTLLSQVDASIGGKTGVNLRGYKNIIGVITQPLFTYICPGVLETLPYSEFQSGAAEMLKTFIIRDGGCYRRAVEFFSGAHRSNDRKGFIMRNAGELAGLVKAAANVKSDIVSMDEHENGIRRVLNLGHTFAHAIEWDAMENGGAAHGISHGEAVSVGIVCAAFLSEAEGCCREGLAGMIRHDLFSCGLPVNLPVGIDALAGAMSKDKKAENGKVRFVLIADIGKVIIVSLKVEETVKILENHDLYDYTE